MNSLGRLLVVLLVFTPAARADDAPPAAPVAESAPPAASEVPAPQPAMKSVTRTAAMDHLELDPTAITGNRELPKVMVIVPWKKADRGELTVRPANSLLNEVLEPVDREVFRRELRYFEALEAKPET